MEHIGDGVVEARAVAVLRGIFGAENVPEVRFSFWNCIGHKFDAPDTKGGPRMKVFVVGGARESWGYR